MRGRCAPIQFLLLGIAAASSTAVAGHAQIDQSSSSFHPPPNVSDAKDSDALDEPAYIEGPDGRLLIKFNGSPADEKIVFRQIASNLTKVQVVGSDTTFEISRLPATFMATVGHEICTATLVGPKVLLPAAHCVDAKKFENDSWQTLGGSVLVADGSSGQDIHSCMMAPAYTEAAPKKDTVRNQKDYALCELVLPLGIRAEPIALASALVVPGTLLLIAGYGCTEDDLTGKKITGQTPASGMLHVGTNRVLGGGPHGWIELLGRIGFEDAILCPGDSGGAAFAGASISVKNSDFGWRVVAVNSSVGPSGQMGEYFSYLAPLADPAFKELLDKWVAKRPSDRKICGIDTQELGPECRQ